VSGAAIDCSTIHKGVAIHRGHRMHVVRVHVIKVAIVDDIDVADVSIVDVDVLDVSATAVVPGEKRFAKA